MSIELSEKEKNLSGNVLELSLGDVREEIVKTENSVNPIGNQAYWEQKLDNRPFRAYLGYI
jgi:hypothetical protein